MQGKCEPIKYIYKQFLLLTFCLIKLLYILISMGLFLARVKMLKLLRKCFIFGLS